MTTNTARPAEKKATPWGSAVLLDEVTVAQRAGEKQKGPMGLMGRGTPAFFNSSEMTSCSSGSASSPHGRGQCGTT